MLCAIRYSDNKKVLARDESKSNKPFFCPICSDEAILKKGTVKVHHFAHKPPVTCEYGRGETEKHRMCKMEVFEGLKEHRRFRQVELEKGMGTVRPDISASFLQKLCTSELSGGDSLRLRESPPESSLVHNFCKKLSWYNQDGDEESAGGYEKRYKRYRTPKRGRVVTLSHSFDPMYRKEPWRSKTLIVPESRLLMDTQPVWWGKNT
jgi:competence protein CoiA-like protein